MKHLDQYAGAYAMDEAKFRAMVDIVQQTDLKQHQAEFLAAQKDRKQMGAYQVTQDGYAVVNLIGAMTKYGSSFSDTMPFGTIGVRKAVGAKRRDVLMQFLIEAALLAVLGGAIGILLGYGLGAILCKALLGVTGSIPLWAVLAAFGVPALIGVIFGLYPAAKASKLDPIEALRYE